MTYNPNQLIETKWDLFRYCSEAMLDSDGNGEENEASFYFVLQTRRKANGLSYPFKLGELTK